MTLDEKIRDFAIDYAVVVGRQFPNADPAEVRFHVLPVIRRLYGLTDEEAEAYVLRAVPDESGEAAA